MPCISSSILPMKCLKHILAKKVSRLEKKCVELITNDFRRRTLMAIFWELQRNMEKMLQKSVDPC